MTGIINPFSALRRVLRGPAVTAMLLWGVVALSLGGWAEPVKAQREAYSIVMLRVTSQYYDPVLPWDKNVERSITGNAVVVAGKQLLTSADMVKNANLLQVRKFGRYPDWAAKVVTVDYELNLALLTVEEDAFWEGLKPLPLAKKPIPTGRFTINRWRNNGRFEQGSGEVVEHRLATSPFGTMEFAAMLGSTAMGGLGWGEILTYEGQLIGLLFSHSEQRIQSTNSDLLQLFIEASGKPSHQVFAHRGFSWQVLNHPHLRAYLKLQDDRSGVLIRKVYQEGTGAGVLREGDILHRLGDYDIDPEGFINHPDYGAIKFPQVINETLAESLTAEITREGKLMNVSVPRRRFSKAIYRVSPPIYDQPIDYQVFGGLVLRELSLNYLRAWGKGWQNKAPTRLVLEYVLNSIQNSEESTGKVVFISKVLPDPVNLGYENVVNDMVVSANGKPVTSLESFREAIEHPVKGFHVIELLPGQSRHNMVFRESSLAGANARIARRYGLPLP